jgi:phosphatidylinositol glycan class B
VLEKINGVDGQSSAMPNNAGLALEPAIEESRLRWESGKTSEVNMAPPVPWRYLRLILSFALLARIAVALFTDSVVHPDATFQYLEQAHRLVFGYGTIPWEYVYGVRSWIVPGFVAALLKALAFLGFDRPDVYVPGVKIVFCCISISLPWSMYRITQSLFDETSARFALLAGSFWYELIVYSHQPLPDAISAYTLFIAIVFLFARQRFFEQALFGIFAGLTFVLRFQLAPLIAVLFLIAACRWRWQVLRVMPEFLGVLCASGALDAYTWGRWFSSIVSNLELNVVANIASTFGTSPAYYYFATLTILSFGLVWIGAGALVFTWRKGWPLLLLALVDLLEFSMIGHKESRFVFVCIPIYLIGIAVLVALLLHRSRLRLLESASGFPAGAIGLTSTVVMVSAAGLCYVLPFEYRLYHHPTVGRTDAAQAYLELSRADRVSGVIDDSPGIWGDTGGFYMLHKPVPIYRADLTPGAMPAVRKSPLKYASHWILPLAMNAPAEYMLAITIGQLRIWELRPRPNEVAVAPGYTRLAPSHRPIPVSPSVTPRW